jgi:hypothetical protein
MKDSWFPPSFQDAAPRWDFQPLRGWLISIVASRQKEGFYRAPWRLRSPKSNCIVRMNAAFRPGNA